MRSIRSFGAVSAAAALALVLSACSGGSSPDAASPAAPDAASGDLVTLTVGASPSPHAKILQYIDDTLAAGAGLDLEIVEYSDYIQPNSALEDGSLDANFFQTVPYLEIQEKENGYDFEAGKGIHLEPLAVFSNKIASLDELPAGGTIGIISDTANQARALKVLADQGLVELPADGSDANVNNVKILKDFTFTEVDGPQLVRSLADVDAAVINGNYAQEGGLSLSGDALVTESPENNPSVNILAWKAGSEKSAAIAELEKLLHSDEVKQYIEQTWTDGSVIPAF
ncbi:MetQ/NlpA family ABC transporter substrate-binding protein [Actinomyces sp. B33]|uniref:MetQ/NlpA family ABC transporter substrate-binding protein n=1 Tax=Actinomyces sp. B33 TaxID=2942131 RepID=UPI002341E44A|nr:MetQ/NlpA family ABC transporter substrate-binding protein [Actinomyces sp. B33]MDC4233936.1 MetQ/NlpA family ABC transporter substrate-binding protein [Actinomyces sp. B33]